MSSGLNSGDSYGCGYGFGYGDGSSYGYGSSYGSGSGYGFGDGYGSEKYYQYILGQYKAPKNTTLAFWWSDEQGKPCNGGSGQPVKAGDTQEVKGPLELCSHRALHATQEFHKWKGDRLWVVAMHHPIESDGEKLGSLKRTIIAEIKIK